MATALMDGVSAEVPVVDYGNGGGGPRYDDVIREMPMPAALLGPEPVQQKELSEIAEEQTVALRHIAMVMSRVAERSITDNYLYQDMAKRALTRLEDLTAYTMWGIMVQSVTVVATCAWLLVR